MQTPVKYIYPKIWRIPKDYISKCNLKTELFENKNCKIHILNVICGSHLLHFSPYDSALILDLLTDRFDNNSKVSSLKSSGSLKCKSHSLYRPAVKRIVDSVINYRTELFPYFYRKFSELHEKTALTSLVSTILDTNSLQSYNINVLIDLSYLTSYHIPVNCLKSSELEDPNKEYKLYSRFYRELLDNLSDLLSKNRNSLNKVLVYKLLYSLSKIPFKYEYKKIYCLISDKLTELLKNDSWESQYLIRIYSSLFNLGLLDSGTRDLIYRCIELIIYQLTTKDLKLILSTSSKLNDKSSLKLTTILKDKLNLYTNLQWVTIRGNVIMALSKTHPLYQNDKATLSEEAAELIASTVEFRLKQILDLARKLLNNSMRPINSNVLTTQDIRSSLRSLNMPEMDGYSNSFEYRYVWATKLFKGDRVIKRESSYRTSMGEKIWGRYKLSHLLKQDPQKPVPLPSGLTVNWSVVGGMVPLMATGMVEDVTTTFLKTSTNLEIKDKIKDISFLDYIETEEKLDNLTALAKDIKPLESDLTPKLGGEYLDKALLDAINKQIINEKNLAKTQNFVIPKIDYILTKEHRFFLKEIKNMLKRASFSQEPDIQIQYKKVVELLRSSLGLDQLLPELCHLFINEINRINSNHPSFNIHLLLQYVEALTSNQNIQIHHYVHQLLIPLLQVLLSCEMDTNPIQIYKSLLLRKLSAQCISNISFSLKKNNNGLESIDDYLMNLYKNELTNGNCTLPVLYGALCGISKLPLVAKRIVFYPLVPLILAVVLRKQKKHKVFRQNRQKQRLKNFKQILLHEILHLLLEIIYDCSFEDVLSTLEETGQLLAASYEANTMVNEILMGSVNSSINPELILQVYAAMLNKCYTLLGSVRKTRQVKRKYCQISDSSVSSTQNSCNEGPPEVANIKNYYSFLKRANPDMDDESGFPDTQEVLSANSKKFGSKIWYNLNSVHALTLTI